MHIGLKIKVTRIAKGLSQQELADQIGKTRPLISHIEQTGEVKHETLQKICKALGVSIHIIENIINEPTHIHNRKELAQINLIEENKRLVEENAILRELIQSQKELIATLKSRNTK